MIKIVIHGGAGAIVREKMSTDKERTYRAVLEEALSAGYGVLMSGGTALESVEAAIRVMEDSPSYNAGKGSVLTHNGRIEMDAAIMNGCTLNAGAVAGVTTIKNPISAAHAVLMNSPHVFLIGAGAEEFAKEQGLQLEELTYFITEERLEQWKELSKTKQTALDHTVESTHEAKHLGTVGAVALDRYGNLAAATSTGGMSNKRYGRIGDSPLIGAGTYANTICAISATGHGEYFIRTVCAHTISALMEFKGFSLREASDYALKVIENLGGEGGLIGIDREGNIALPYNTLGMYRGWTDETGNFHTAIFEEEFKGR